MGDLSAEEFCSLKSWRADELLAQSIDLYEAMSIQSSVPRHRTRSAEVIVVGAGLSGLQTAYELQEAGISCLVLEAQNRLGGRLRSVADGRGVKADFGGAWIDASQTRAVNLLRGLGVEMVKENVRGESILEGAGRYKFGEVPNLGEDDQRSYIRVRENLETLSQRVDLNNPTILLPNYGPMTVLDLVASQGATPAVRALAETWTATLFGLAARDVGALHFLLVCKTHGGFLATISQSPRRMRFRRGAQDLASAMAERLRPGTVRFAQEVVWVDQTSSNKCVLTTAEGEVFQCERVVLAVSTSVYGAIEFNPELSEEKQWMQTYEQPGFYAEAVLVYKQPWWRDHGLNGFSQSTQGPIWETRDTSNDADGVYSLTCILAGSTGRDLFHQPYSDRRTALLTYLGSIYVDVVPIPDPLEVHKNNWSLNTWTRPVPCPAIHRQNQWMAEDRIHFVGSEAAHVWRGHIEGALASGSRGAEEVLAVMRPVEDGLLAPRL